MKQSFSLLFVFLVFSLFQTLKAQSAFINEVNYIASDPAGQGLEIAGESGQNLQGWSVVIYELDGTVKSVEELQSQTIPNQQRGYGTIWYEMDQMSGGNGIALINPVGTVEHFIGIGLSTLGGITATEGPAQGMTSSYAGAQLLPDLSLQLTGTGQSLLDFVWAIPLGGATPGEVNNLQTFVGGLLRGLFGYSTAPSTTENFDNQIDIKAFPNPTTDYLRLQLPGDATRQGALPVSLFDARGQLVQQVRISPQQWNLELDLRDLSAGYYLLRVGEGSSALVQKILKQ